MLTATVALAGCTPRLAPIGPVPVPINGPALPAPFAGPQDLVFVIPAGTFAAEMRGEPSFSLPSPIHVTVGQAIAIRNEDQAMHYFFDVPIAPGQTIRKTFNEPGSFGYRPGLSCSLGRDGSITVDVAGTGSPTYRSPAHVPQLHDHGAAHSH
jgi:hypothetical protein